MRYSCLNSHSRTVHSKSPGCFNQYTTLPYPNPTKEACHGFGGVLEPRYIVGAESLDQ